ncbi:hypothetical protein B0H13DRAFT_1880203 [Mycena leptocephala]|nr:hypothetical protein B0H13DRAFT_1880203 [Mycena leptocephala]
MAALFLYIALLILHLSSRAFSESSGSEVVDSVLVHIQRCDHRHIPELDAVEMRMARPITRNSGYSAVQNSDTIHLMPLQVDSGEESAGVDDSELAGTAGHSSPVEPSPLVKKSLRHVGKTYPDGITTEKS